MAKIALRLRITINGRAYDVTVEELEGDGPAGPEAGPPLAEAPPPGPATAPAPAPAGGGPAGSGAPGQIRAPLPGVVTEVRCRAGQAVASGQVLLILEAMKMDNEIVAPRAGTVTDLRVARGDQVAPGQVLAVLGS